jgi:hypothetical protein
MMELPGLRKARTLDDVWEERWVILVTSLFHDIQSHNMTVK